MPAYQADIIKLVCWQCQLLTAVTGFTRCLFHLAVCVWMTKLSELRWDYDWEPNSVSPTSVHAAPRSVRKALTASHADAVLAEQLDITL